MWKRSRGSGRRPGACWHELQTVVGVSALEDLRLLNRYDVEGLDEAAFRRAVGTVFSEPQVDDTAAALPAGDCIAFGVEPLPGQFDQRADSCRPVHSADDSGGAAHGAAPPGSICSSVHLTGGGCGRGQAAMSSTPWSAGRRLWTSRSRWRQPDRRPGRRGNGHGLHCPGPGGPGCPAGATAVSPWTWTDLTFLPGLLPGRGAPGPHPDGDPGGGHLLVRPLPPHHLLHPSGPRGRSTMPTVQAAYQRYLAARVEVYGDGEGRPAAPDPDGYGHHRRQGA